MNNKIIRVLSRQNFNAHINNLNFIDMGIPNDVAIIEIFNSDVCENAVNRFGVEDDFNYVNNLQSAKLFGDNVCHLVFDDITNSKSIKIDGTAQRLTKFNFHHAKTLLKFIIDNFNKKEWIIHCSAGISRSGAVGLFLFELFRSKNFNVIFDQINHIHPNSLVFELLNKTKDCFEFSDFIKDVDIFPTITKTQLIPWDISNDDVKENKDYFKTLFVDELNENEENINRIIDDIINDKIDLVYINKFKYENILLGE